MMEKVPINWIALPSATVLSVHGEDSYPYLQSQVARDLPAETPDFCRYTVWLNAKGRVEGDCWVLRTAETAFLLISFHTPQDRLTELVERHIIADEVEVEPVDAPVIAWATVLNGDTERELDAMGLPTPDPDRWTGSINSRFAFREERGGQPLCILVAPESEGEESSGGLSDDTQHTAWTRERIRRRIPALPEEAGPRDTPFDLNLEADAVSFTKGCFLGQEVMAKLKSRNHTGRMLVTVTGKISADGAPPASESSVYQDGRSVGRILCAVAELDNWIGLAQIHRDRGGGSTPLKLENGTRIERLGTADDSG